MDLDPAVLAPFQSVLLARARSGACADEFVTDLVGDLALVVPSVRGRARREVVNRSGVSTDGTLAWAHLYYRSVVPSSWTTGSYPADVTHGLIVVCLRHPFAAIHFSEPKVRQTVADILDGDTAQAPLCRRLNDLETLPADTLGRAYVGSRLRSIWLRGVHHPGTVKPAGKSATGNDLGSTIDPVSDQTFAYTALRSIPAGWATALGVNPERSSVWQSRSGQWSDFRDFVSNVIDELDAAGEGADDNEALSVFAVPVSLREARDAYEAVLASPDVPEDGQAADQDDLAVQDWWSTAVELQVEPSEGANFTARAFVGGEKVGDLEVWLEADKRQRARVNVKSISGPQPERLKEVASACRRRGALTIYYDSGHTVMGQRCWQVRYTDVRFPGWRWANFDGVRRDKEKPTSGHPRAGGDSLFDWVLRSWPLDDPGTGWLVCDDGPGEAADFIHLSHRLPRTITLLHIKAASETGGTGIAVVPYEQVVSQAVKNLRYLHPEILRDHLAGRLRASTARRVWLDGTPADLFGLVREISSLGERHSSRVAIVQPHITRSVHDAARNDPGAQGLRLRRLNALLDCAKRTARGHGAKDLYVVGAARA